MADRQMDRPTDRQTELWQQYRALPTVKTGCQHANLSTASLSINTPVYFTKCTVNRFLLIKPWEICGALLADRLHFHNYHNPSSAQTTETHIQWLFSNKWTWNLSVRGHGHITIVWWTAVKHSLTSDYVNQCHSAMLQGYCHVISQTSRPQPHLLTKNNDPECNSQ